MTVPINQIRKEFDQIALLTERHGHGGVGDTYHNYLLQQLPPHSENTLEIGCGTGAFTRLMAARARSILGIDLSSQMIRLAKSQSANCQNIQYLLGDVMSIPLPAEKYDCVVSIATLHHLPLEQALVKMKDALKPNGLLVIHDLVAAAGLVESGRSALAYPVSAILRFRTTGRLRMTREVREAWAEHGKGESYLTLTEVNEMCRQYLPQAQIKRHLLWRYTVVWHKNAV